MKTAIEIIKILKANHYDGYIVGGWVRDKILGRESSDIDIATDATPDEVKAIFKGIEKARVIPTGEEHGTMTVIHEHFSDEGYEITTFRRDVSTDGRNATVEFAKTIADDLSRRDFTMNAIAYDPIDGVYLDPFGGMKDIEEGIIRAVGDANERFKEDHLRMLRALRFEATLKFNLHVDVVFAIEANAHLINNISKERIKMEVDKCFEKSGKPSTMITNMYHTSLIDYIFPELKVCIGFAQNKYHKHDVFVHTMIALDAVPKEYPLIRWAVLFHDLGKPESCENYGEPHASFHMHEKISRRIARNIMTRLKFSNDDKNYISNLVDCHMFQCSAELTDRAIRRFIVKLGAEYVDDICILKYADRAGNGTKTVTELNVDNTALKRRFVKIMEEASAFKIGDLAIGGGDVMKIKNIKPSPEVGKILNKLLDMVLDEPSLNTEEKLTWIVKNNPPSNGVI